MLKISIIIPYYKPLDYLQMCLQALHANTLYPLHEVIIVNDGSPDSDSLRKFIPEVKPRLFFPLRFIDREENRGFVYTCNEGADIATGEWLLFLNFDTLPQRGWLTALVSAIRQHPEVGLWGSRLFYPGINLIQHCGGAFNNQGNPIHIYQGAPAFLPFLNKNRKLQWVTGASFLVRKEDFIALAGFDAIYGSSSEDIDFCFKMRFVLGKEVWVAAASILYHHANVTGISSSNVDRTHRLFSQKWGDRIQKDEDIIYQSDGFAPAFLRLLEHAGVVNYFGNACSLIELLNLQDIAAQETYARTRGETGLREDVAALSPQLVGLLWEEKEHHLTMEQMAPDASHMEAHYSYNRIAVQKMMALLGKGELADESRQAIYQQMLQRLDGMSIYTILYNLASMFAVTGKREEAITLFSFLARLVAPFNPSLAGKADFKLAELTLDAAKKKDHLVRCLQLYPEHNLARQTLSVLVEREQENY